MTPADPVPRPADADVVVDHPIYGPALPALNWVPAPRYLLRRDRVLRLVADLPPGRVLDIGCGPGALLRDLADRGFTGVGVDSSRRAVDLARRLHPEGGPVSIHSSVSDDWSGSFDLVCAFEVLEHLEDDVGALRQWRRYLRSGGRLIISSPAHPEMWNAADEWAGHVRRYTRSGWTEMIEDAGFVVERLECYGFPVANVMERWRARVYGRQLRDDARAGLDARELTAESGSDRQVETRLWNVFARRPVSWAMALSCQLQRPFVGRDLGNGYLALARVT